MKANTSPIRDTKRNKMTLCIEEINGKECLGFIIDYTPKKREKTKFEVDINDI
jgi:hypothetical protein